MKADTKEARANTKVRTDAEVRTDTEKKAGRTATRTLVYVGMFAAVLAVLSQIAIPMPTGVPVTLQTFAVALTGAVLGWRLAFMSTAVYILLGAAGVPVFSGFSGGLGRLTGLTGGFIWGFLFMALLCGAGSQIKKKVPGFLIGLAGLLLCHLAGAGQYALIARVGFRKAFLLVSAPYLIKDIISVALAFLVGTVVRGRLIKAGLFSGGRSR